MTDEDPEVLEKGSKFRQRKQSLMQISAYQQKAIRGRLHHQERIQRAECFLYSFFVSFGKGGL